jgi:hypothetical protein
MIAIDIEHEKQEAIKRIRDIVDEHLHPTGWLKSGVGERPKQYLQAITFYKNDPDGFCETEVKTIELPAHTFEGIMGFTDCGVIVDIYMALVTQPYDNMPLEDLLVLAQWVEDEFYSHARR